jgi:sodium-dependent dicarboxylate transporter 2/3/5
LYWLTEFADGKEVAIILMIIIVTVILTNVMSDGAAAAILVPITLAVGFQADLPLESIALITAISTAFAFMTSFGTPPNLIVQASGIPKSNDFVKNGVPLVIFAISLLIIIEQYYWVIAREWVGL